MAVTFACTPSNLTGQNPCLNCLSEHELTAVLVALFATATTTYQNNLPLLMENSACYTCLGKKDMLVGLIAILANQILTGTTVAEIIERYKCLVCATPKQLEAAFLYLICNNFTVAVDQGR